MDYLPGTSRDCIKKLLKTRGIVIKLMRPYSDKEFYLIDQHNKIVGAWNEKTKDMVIYGKA